MNIQDRIALFVALGKKLAQQDAFFQEKAAAAERENGWFVTAFTQKAAANIAGYMLLPEQLNALVNQYQLATAMPCKTVGLVMAGNIPMVGFHDLMMVLLAGHKAVVKLSSKDKVLMTYLMDEMKQINPGIADFIEVRDQLKGCDAYIATGSNNSGRYFEYYFGKYPNIIRRNRTSVAILDGSETATELQLLAEDMLTYFGLGCRNVTALRVPEGYEWEPLLAALKAFEWMKDHHKFRNNFDYQLSLHLLNNKFYMTDDNVLFVENPSIFSPIATVHYQYYSNEFDATAFATDEAQNLQCLVGRDTGINFGNSQKPGLTDYADGVDTLTFLRCF